MPTQLPSERGGLSVESLESRRLLAVNTVGVAPVDAVAARPVIISPQVIDLVGDYEGVVRARLFPAGDDSIAVRSSVDLIITGQAADGDLTGAVSLPQFGDFGFTAVTRGRRVSLFDTDGSPDFRINARFITRNDERLAGVFTGLLAGERVRGSFRFDRVDQADDLFAPGFGSFGLNRLGVDQSLLASNPATGVLDRTFSTRPVFADSSLDGNFGVDLLGTRRDLSTFPVIAPVSSVGGLPTGSLFNPGAGTAFNFGSGSSTGLLTDSASGFVPGASFQTLNGSSVFLATP